MKRVKVIIGYAANARFLSETGEMLGYIPRQPIRSPYAYSPTHLVYEWQGKRIIQVETGQRRYEVFELPTTMPVFKTEEEICISQT